MLSFILEIIPSGVLYSTFDNMSDLFIVPQGKYDFIHHSFDIFSWHNYHDVGKFYLVDGRYDNISSSWHHIKDIGIIYMNLARWV